MANKTLEMTMLFDFYGGMLTEKQREYFDLYYNNDLSLSEIAESAGITRQGVHDLIARAETAMTDMESKIGAIARFNELRECVSKAQGLVDDIIASSKDEQVLNCAGKLSSLLGDLKG